jgi:DNA-binding transcriptional regulator YiaG
MHHVYSRGMTGTEVKRLRRRLGLTQAGLAARVGVHKLTVARWEWGDVRVTEPMARLLKLLATTVPTTPKGGRRR